MAQPTTHTFPLSEPQTLLERRQQSAPYLQQLELPSLPPLSHLLTEKNGSKEEEMTKAATEAALQAATAVTASMITTTAQPLIQHDTHPVSFLPETSITSAPTNLLYSYTNPRENDSIPAVDDAVALFPANNVPITTSTRSSNPMIMNPSGFMEQHTLFNPVIAAGLTEPQQLITNHLNSPISSPMTALNMHTSENAMINGFPTTGMGMTPSYMRRQSSVSSTSSDKAYSFVAIPGTNQRKRPRRRYDEIERLYHCNWPGCTKAYGTLNHLNAHVSMQQHGPKRHPAEFKEMRKEWRRLKKEREAAKKQAEAVYQEQQLLQQQMQPFPFTQPAYMPNTMSSLVNTYSFPL
ncbi:hypothetical protein EDC96DRAFT_529509 [Choanephora cucurbitarum]|nr:hypothetical protein EDC96DRAFT_529509 [Choanephora cucurbitarum]